MKIVVILKSNILYLGLLLLLSACNSNPVAGKKLATIDAPLINTKTKDVPVIELSGNGHNRGLQHGKLLKSEIAEVFTKWKTGIQNNSKQDVDTVITAFLAATNFETRHQEIYTSNTFN